MRDAGADIEAHTVSHHDLRHAPRGQEYTTWLHNEVYGCKETLETGVDDIAFPPARDRQFQGSDEQAKRRVRITKRSIDKACEEFFRSRGMQIKVGGDVWRRAKGAFRSRHTD